MVPFQKQSGVTLVEMAIAIAVFGISVVALYSATSSATQRSANPIKVHEALALAESHMDHVLAHRYSVTPPPTGCSGAACLNDVRDFHTGNNPNDYWEPRSVQGQTASFAGYRVGTQVGVVEFFGVPALQVDVEVVPPALPPVALRGWKFCRGELNEGGGSLCPAP